MGETSSWTRRAAVGMAVIGAAAAVGVATASPAAAPPPPIAASAAVDRAGDLRVDGTNIVNTMTATRVDAVTVVLDDTHTITAGSGCTHSSPGDTTVVSCTVAPVNPDLRVYLWGGDDDLTLAGVGCVWWAALGPGADEVDTTAAHCDDGDDYGIFLDGGGGDDLFVSGTSKEVIEGSSDVDTVSYAGPRSPAAGVVVDLEGQQGGNPLAEDAYESIENVVGTAFDDTISGNGGVNDLDGGDGADTLWGAAFNDWLTGGDGDDVIAAGLGFDIIDGGDGDDECDLGPDGISTAFNCES